MKTLEQVTAISASDREFLREVKALIRRLLPDARVLLYGSVARGTQEPHSDYDILILTKNAPAKKEKDELESGILLFELEREVVVSTIYYTDIEWSTPIVRVSPFHGEVERDAIIL